MYHQVASLDEVGPHLARQEGVLVVRGVVPSRGEDRHPRRSRPCAQGHERGIETFGICGDLADPVLAVQGGERPLGGRAAGQHVRHAGRDPHVVLDHGEALVGAHDVGAADGHVDVVRHLHAAHFDPVLGTAEHEVGGNHTVPQRIPLVVDVAQEEVHRAHALLDPVLDVLPLGGLHDARHAVDRDDVLGHLLLAQNREGDAFVEEAAVHAVLHPGQFPGGNPRQHFAQAATGRAGRTILPEQLVEEAGIQIVVRERSRPGGAGNFPTVADTAHGGRVRGVQGLSRPQSGSR